MLLRNVVWAFLGGQETQVSQSSSSGGAEEVEFDLIVEGFNVIGMRLIRKKKMLQE